MTRLILGLARSIATVAVAFALLVTTGLLLRAAGWPGPDTRLVTAAVRFTAQHQAFRTLLVVWQTALYPSVAYAAALPVAALAWRRGRHERVPWAVATSAACWGSGAVAKLLVARPRPHPDHPVAVQAGYSFPSGHATNDTAAVLIMLVLAWPMLHGSGRRLAAGIAGLVVVLTCLDRVFLGVHHPTDVLAGVAFALVAVAGSYRAFGSSG